MIVSQRDVYIMFFMYFDKSFVICLSYILSGSSQWVKVRGQKVRAQGLGAMESRPRGLGARGSMGQGSRARWSGTKRVRGRWGPGGQGGGSVDE